jgi:hypothetical protein
MYLIDALSDLLCVLLVDGSNLIKTVCIQHNSNNNAYVHKCKVTKAKKQKKTAVLYCSYKR